ncbi:MAG: hypothetical protein ACKOC8_07425 [Pirellulales bacterium]
MPDQPLHRDPSAAQAPVRSRPWVRMAAGDTTVVFTWAGDRWRHAITLPSGEVVESLEGPADGGDPRWPASPPLVEVTAVQTARGPATLAVGLAGRSHYSASISPLPDRDGVLLFEIACRFHDQPPWLGSSYRRAGTLVRIAAGSGPWRAPGTVQWSYTIGPGGIVATPPAVASGGP